MLLVIAYFLGDGRHACPTIPRSPVVPPALHPVNRQFIPSQRIARPHTFLRTTSSQIFMATKWPPPPVDLFRVDAVAHVGKAENLFFKEVWATDAADAERMFWELLEGFPPHRQTQDIQILSVRVIPWEESEWSRLEVVEEDRDRRAFARK
jgi:hypothetical protein